MKKFLKKIIGSFHRKNKIKEKEVVKDTEALVQLNPLIDIYLPWSGSALRPSIIKLILNDILIHERKNIIECGSGISTLYIASLLKQYSLKDCTIYSIDHDLKWINKLKYYLKRLGLTNQAQLIHAPLEPFENDFTKVNWYRTSVLNDYLRNVEIDQLIVDGPPAYKKEIKYSRYPAAVFFEDRFNEDFSIFLDDLDRKAERVIAERWSKILNVDFRHKYDDKSFGIAMRGNAYNI